MITQEMVPFFQNRTDDMLAHLETLVRYETPTHDKTLVDELGTHLHQTLESLGATVEVIPRDTVGDIRLAKWNADTDGLPILILVHLDTVWQAGTLDSLVPFVRHDTKLHGPGVLDMKAGIVIALEAIRGLQERGEFPNRPIWMLLTTDEEKGSDHSQELIIETAKSCGLCLVMEPATENEGIKTSRKGIARYTVQANGKAAHAGVAPEEGVNAIIELAHQAIAINKLNNLRKGTSVSVTMIEGGTTGNVIPAEASLYVDVRFFYTEEAERVDQAITSLSPATFGSTLSIQGGIHRMPLERTEAVVNSYQQAKRLADSIGLPLAEGAVGGVSDGNVVAQAGIPVLDGMGGHGDGLHALHEHVLIRSLHRRAALMAMILRDWEFEN